MVVGDRLWRLRVLPPVVVPLPLLLLPAGGDATSCPRSFRSATKFTLDEKMWSLMESYSVARAENGEVFASVEGEFPSLSKSFSFVASDASILASVRQPLFGGNLEILDCEGSKLAEVLLPESESVPGKMIDSGTTKAEVFSTLLGPWWSRQQWLTINALDLGTDLPGTLLVRLSHTKMGILRRTEVEIVAKALPGATTAAEIAAAGVAGRRASNVEGDLSVTDPALDPVVLALLASMSHEDSVFLAAWRLLIVMLLLFLGTCGCACLARCFVATADCKCLSDIRWERIRKLCVGNDYLALESGEQSTLCKDPNTPSTCAPSQHEDSFCFLSPRSVWQAAPPHAKHPFPDTDGDADLQRRLAELRAKKGDFQRQKIVQEEEKEQHRLAQQQKREAAEEEKKRRKEEKQRLAEEKQRKATEERHRREEEAQRKLLEAQQAVEAEKESVRRRLHEAHEVRQAAESERRELELARLEAEREKMELEEERRRIESARARVQQEVEQGALQKQQLAEARMQAEEARRQAEQEKEAAEEARGLAQQQAERDAVVKQQLAEARLKAEQARQQAEQEKEAAEAARRLAQQDIERDSLLQRQLVEAREQARQAQRKAAEEKEAADEARRQAQQEAERDAQLQQQLAEVWAQAEQARWQADQDRDAAEAARRQVHQEKEELERARLEARLSMLSRIAEAKQYEERERSWGNLASELPDQPGTPGQCIQDTGPRQHQAEQAPQMQSDAGRDRAGSDITEYSLHSAATNYSQNVGVNPHVEPAEVEEPDAFRPARQMQ